MNPVCHRVEREEEVVKGQWMRRGTVYYLNDDGQFHRLDGPAIERPPSRASGWSEGKSWYVDGKWIFSVGLKTHVNQILSEKEYQEFLLRLRPDLISQIRHLHPDLKAKYSHELEMSRIDV